MNKIFKKIKVTVGMILGVILILAVMYMLQIIKMSPLKTGKVTDHVFAINDLFVNLYVIQCDDTYAVVDGGNRVSHIEEEIKKLGINKDRVKAVFLTHSDWDHIGAVGLFKNAEIYIAKAEETMINGKTARFLWQKNKLNYPSHTMEDGETVKVGNRQFKGIWTPGHTPGSMCFLVDDTNLFTGDTLRLKKGKATVFNKLFNMNTKIQQESINKLKTIPNIQYIFTAHYGFSNDIPTALGNTR